MAKQIAVQEDISPNLIPMIDIMFLLLLFLMIASDMGQRELEQVELPKAQSVRKDDLDTKTSEGDRITINVWHKLKIKCPAYEGGQICREEGHWLMGVKGIDYSNMDKLEAFLRKEADRHRGKDPKYPQASDKKVMIRADGAAPYGMPQKAMNACAKVGIYKIDVGAARPVDDKKRK
jgi:biopolymer transport protein ExbD